MAAIFGAMMLQVHFDRLALTCRGDSLGGSTIARDAFSSRNIQARAFVCYIDGRHLRRHDAASPL